MRAPIREALAEEAAVDGAAETEVALTLLRATQSAERESRNPRIASDEDTENKSRMARDKLVIRPRLQTTPANHPLLP